MDYLTIISISLLLVLLRILYSYLSQPFNYWKDLGVPYVPGIPIVGSMLETLTVPFHEVDAKRLKKYGYIYGHYENARPVLNVAEPDLARDIYVKDFHIFPNRRGFFGDTLLNNMLFNVKGETWKRIRTIMTPAFTTGKLKKMFSIISESAAMLSDNMRTIARSGKPMNAKRTFGPFSMDVIVSCALGTKIDSHSDPDNPFVATAREAFLQKYPWRFFLNILMPSVLRLFRLSGFSPTATKFFGDITLQIIEERRRTGKRPNDVMQLMLDAADEAKKGKVLQVTEDLEEDERLKDMGHEEGNEEIFKLTSTKGLTDDEVIANCVIFFLAGYDTTASSLTMVSYLLALNPDCQEELIAEVDQAIKQNGNQLNYEAIHSMKYLEMVISESLRLYPAAVRGERVAESDYELGNTGITIKKDQIVGIPIYAIHHHPNFYPEPEKFDPMRFSPEEKAKRDSYTYLPFGAGPRNCIGMRFALLEMKICLAYTISQFRFKRCPQTKVPMEFHAGQNLMQPKEVLIALEERKDRVFIPRS